MSVKPSYRRFGYNARVFQSSKIVAIPLAPNPRIAIVRFSALGDVVMVSAAIRALQKAKPEAEITWFTSPLSFSLLEGMPRIRFVVVNKPRTLSDYRHLYKQFGESDFDVVLAMQANLRINLLYPALRAPLKIGFDRTRAREGQWWLCDQHIPFHDDHLVDSFLSFVTTLTGQSAEANWGLPICEEDVEWAEQTFNNFKSTLTPTLSQKEREPIWLIAIHPHASKAERNWLPERYVEVIQRTSGSIVLTGGNSPAELALCERLANIVPDRTLNLCGKTSPKQLAAVLSKVDVLIAPDTGAVHIARAMDTPVIGLYAVASPKLTGPYQRTEYCVNRYPQAVRKYLGKDPERLPWNTRVHHPDAMSLIEVDDVLQHLARVLENAK